MIKTEINPNQIIETSGIPDTYKFLKELVDILAMKAKESPNNYGQMLDKLQEAADILKD